MRNCYLLLLLFLMSSCASLRKLPKEQYHEFVYYFDCHNRNDSVIYTLRNPLMCPLNIKLIADSLNAGLKDKFGHITLRAKQDSVVKIHYKEYNATPSNKYLVRYGDIAQPIVKNKLSYPFAKGKKYKVIQGYNGSFTHNNRYSQYAIDFNLGVGDTIHAADDGYVVGVIQDYSQYGTSKDWLYNDKSNYITLYHPHSGLYTQYVHLQYKGSLVSLGDKVKRGQAIAICGMTGFTTTPHVHFNVKIPTDEYGLISTPIDFENGISGFDLKKNVTVFVK